MVALLAALTLMQNPNPSRDAILARAEAAVRVAVPAAAADPDRPAYHYHAPARWMNDPNGPIRYRGWYHLFYQLHPFGAGSGTKYWGHARSRDLVRWEEMPIALWPSEAEGEAEIWSGSVFPGPGGRPVAIYTSIGRNREPEQWIATPEDDDLARWRKDPVRITQAIHGAKPLAEWRDPFLFTDLGLTYMVTGGGQNGRGVVALYKATSPDLRRWQYLGVLFTHPDPAVRNIECPNLFQVDGKWVLLVSVWPRVEAFVGELRNTSFVVEHRSVLAEGSYASQIFAGVEDRVVHTAWVPTEGHAAWNGFLTLPSELRVAKDGTLLRTPAKELTKLRGKAIRVPDLRFSGSHNLLSLAVGELEMELTLAPGAATRIGVRLGGFDVAYEPESRRLSVGGHAVELPASTVKNGIKLRLFLDRTVLDVYAADGAATLVAKIPHVAPGPPSLFTEGGEATAKGVVAYAIRSPL